jgi:large conductance mechanosensitive channel
MTSMVNDIMTPPIGMVLGYADLKELFFNLNGQSHATLAAVKAAGAPGIVYVRFLNTVINFLIVALVIFIVVRAASKQQHLLLHSDPIPATRCPHSTSQLTVSKGQPE